MGMNTAVLSRLERSRDFGLLVIRLGLGLAFIVYGYPKITGGQQLWEQIGGSMGILGIGFAPTFWGFMAALAEFGGGILLILGLFTRVATLLLVCVMAMASLVHLDKGDPFTTVLHPIELGSVFLGLTFVGPGRFSIDRR
jgi:putative oxidoreductase